MRKEKNVGTRVGPLVILVMLESGRPVCPKHRRSNIENMRSKLQPLNFVMFLSRWQVDGVGDASMEYG